MSRTSPSALRRTTRGSTGSNSASGTQSTVSPPAGSHRGRPVNPGRRSRGRSATRTRSTTSSPARTAPGLKTPTTSKSSRDAGTSSGREQEPGGESRDGHRSAPARWASASASQAVARESRPLASVTTRRWLRSRIQATWSSIMDRSNRP